LKYLSQIRVVNNAQEFSAKGESQRAPGYAITLRRRPFRQLADWSVFMPKADLPWSAEAA